MRPKFCSLCVPNKEKLGDPIMSVLQCWMQQDKLVGSGLLTQFSERHNYFRQKKNKSYAFEMHG